PEIIDTAYESFENRITNQVSDVTLEEKDAIQLYDDLGSGRLELALIFIDRLSNNLYALPFGTGFNNRMLFSTSPHNMYLTLIRDVGIVGLFIYLAWLFSYIYIKNPRKDLRIYYVSLRAITWSMVVTLFFGEHLYIFRPLYALWGMFLLVTAFLFVPLFFHPADK
ncbi:MAG: hypothetical protein GXO24_02600, partial [Chlorobi bacterium]|nr:hypothetical protein [Chlorobiota bacterium]